MVPRADWPTVTGMSLTEATFRNLAADAAADVNAGPAAGPAEIVSRRTVLRGTAVGLAAVAAGSLMGDQPATGEPLLCEPYLLDPGEGSVHVLWATEHEGLLQVVLYGAGVNAMSDAQALAAAAGPQPAGGDWRKGVADSTPLSRTREDAASSVPGRQYQRLTDRPVWRHHVHVTGLEPGRTPYRVVSVAGDGLATLSALYSLAPALAETSSARLLLTSDHQLKPMTPANLTMVEETVGVLLDGVLMAGDFVNVPDRASDWFDSTTGKAFFASMTGRGSTTIAGREYRGARLLQHTPLYPTLGNHEVMGRWSDEAPLATQLDDSQPRWVAERRWRDERPSTTDREGWLARHSWDTTTYQELFPFPRGGDGGQLCYARTIGNIFLVSLFVTCAWRPANTTGKGKFSEPSASLPDSDTWGYGQFIFEPIKRGSPQYVWLASQLSSAAARRARYRVVMFHHSSHGLGENSAPALTDPVQRVTVDPASGAITAVSYGYPLADDHVLRDVAPLLADAKVNLVHNGHAHLWNRFQTPDGINWLETSNVGNSYGAFDVTSGKKRALPASADYVLQGDPGGQRPVVPNLSPLTDKDGNPLPYVASGDITVFSILDSAAGTVRSYRFDLRTPQTPPVLFDEFSLDDHIS